MPVPHNAASRRSVHRFATASLAAAAALCLATLQAPSRAGLHTGGAPHAALWQKVYNALPGSWKSDEAVAIHELTDDEMDRTVRDHGDAPANADGGDQVEGFYEYSDGPDGQPTIAIRDSMPVQHAAFVFTHEYGHFVWEELLNDRAREDYFHVWERQRHAHSLVSSYASDSVEEGFAEAFAFYLREPERLHRKDRSSEEFLDRLLTAKELTALRAAGKLHF